MEVACIVSIPRGGVAVGGFSALLPAFALVPVLAITCFPVAGIAVFGFSAPLSAFALVPVFSAVCLPVGRIGVLGYILFVLADGAFLPVVIAVRFLAVIVLVGEEFDCCSISLSFGDDADAAGAAISVGEIGCVGSAGDALRDFHSFVRRLRGRGHDDSAGGLAKVAGEAEVGAAIQIHIVCRAADQFTVFIRCAALRVAAELQAAGKGDF